MATGNGAQIAFAKIGSLYRDVNTLNIWASFTSESLEHKLEELEEGSITGRRDAPPSHKGLDSGDGDINFEPTPEFIGHLFKAWFGTHVASTVTAAGSTGANSGTFAGAAQMYHKFTPTQAAFSDRTFLEPYNIGVYRDVGSMFIFKGAIMPTLKLSAQAKQLVKCTGTFMARTVDRIERANVASLVSSGGRPWVWDMASVELGTGIGSSTLASRPEFEKTDFTFDLPHEGTALLDGTKKYAEFNPSDFRRMKIEGTMSFRDQATYDQFKAYENIRARFTFLNVNSKLSLGNPASLDQTAFLGYPGFRIHVPLMKFLSWSAPISGPNRVTASFTAKAEYSEAEGFSVIAELLNIVSSNDYSSVY
jgi:hypothetical protein